MKKIAVYSQILMVLVTAYLVCSGIVDYNYRKNESKLMDGSHAQLFEKKWTFISVDYFSASPDGCWTFYLNDGSSKKLCEDGRAKK